MDVTALRSKTPAIDKLAANGLRYTGFHTTALCSPTRACLLTGRNHHAVGMRGVSKMLGHRGIWKDGWKAVTRHVPGTPWEDDVWELYPLDEDFSEAHDVSAEYPERLAEMLELWWQEAAKYQVLPLDDRPAAATFRAARRSGLPGGRDHYVYYPPISHVVADACPSVARGWTLRVAIEHPATGGDGALVNRGTINSGFALYVKDARVHFDYNCFHDHTRLDATPPLAPGPHDIELGVVRGPERVGAVALRVDGTAAAQAKIPHRVGMLSSTGMDLGRALAPVNKDYSPPFAYPGRILKVCFDLPERLTQKDKEGEAERRARAAVARQ